ncbi:MAG: BatA domain-containing protein, partial [Candidatus Omnitrophica bacterium]|nr:BatA domain-containing protein [Candidatus Omnitrophota bacterium]
MHFASPWFLLLLFFLPLAGYLTKRYEFSLRGAFRFSNFRLMKDIKPSLGVKAESKIIYLRMMAIFLLILAVMRPQSVTEETKVYTEGIDIVLAVDTSGSMRAMDFEIGSKRVDRL